MSDFLSSLQTIVDDNAILEGDDVTERTGWHGYQCNAQLLVRPNTTEQLSAIVKLCNHHHQTMVIHGGRTGLASGANADTNDIVVSLERMNKIDNINIDNHTLIVEAGVTLQSIQQIAKDNDLSFTLDLGARGSATIGGLLSTNAGGNQVIRYGMAREQVLGLEVVLADGRILSCMNQMLKNNAGYDLKQLFIGGEGCLGIITKAVLRLRSLIPFRQTSLVAVDDFDKLPTLLRQCDAKFGGNLSAFEVMWNSFINISAYDKRLPEFPLSNEHPYYALIEFSANDQEHSHDILINTIESCMEKELITDALIAQSEKERNYMWSIRDNIDYLMSELRPLCNFDISLPINHMNSYIQAIESELSQLLGQLHWTVFGHLGDSNLHLMININPDIEQCQQRIESVIYKNLQAFGGSITAEHGIGQEKKQYLPLSCNDNQIEVMRQLKTLFDPKNLLNSKVMF